MKLSPKFKIIFLLTLAVLYFSGLGYFLLDHFVKVQGTLGEENSPWQLTSLHMHAVAGLFFLFLFGYLFSVHIFPGLKGRKRKKSGLTVLTVFVILSLTVPGLYYLNDDVFKNYFVFVHTYLGLSTVLLFALHLLA